ncbi:protein phosphatase 2C domain-containing protein [Streptomyces sp. NPDC092369]|uniref:protein phosphatase 2C domain-containing protein n=1 Tax=Streptomyces sp. NPDC092369 TaxID=3366015 RepID=UPI0037F37D22
MSQQGGSPTGHEDDWWGQLYDDSTEDTGPAGAADSLDDRFASATEAVTDGSGGNAGASAGAGGNGGADVSGGAVAWGAGDRAGTGVPAQRPAITGTDAPEAPRTGHVQDRVPWEPPLAAPQAPEPAVAAPPAPTAPPPEPRTPPGTPPTPLGPPPAGFIASVQDAPPAPSTSPVLRTATHLDLPTLPPPHVDYVGSGPPTYDAEPTALPPADPDDLDDLVADTVLDGARYGACTLRAVSVRGDSARFRGEPRRDSLLTARFGTGADALVLVAMATGARATPGAHRAAAEACHWIGRAVGRSHARLAEDIRSGRRGDLKSGLHRLTDRSLGKLRAGAAEQGVDPEEYSATLRCLLLPADPECRTRVFFGVGTGGLFRLRDGEWQDIEPRVTDVTGDAVVGFGSLPSETPEGDRLTMDLGIPTPPSPYEPAPEPPHEPFRFRASVAQSGDTLLMCTGGLAEPLRGEPDLCRYLTGRWAGGGAPGLAAFLADTQVRVKGYADDRTAAAVWEA